MEEPSLEKLLDSAHQELAQFDPHRLHECIRKTNYRPSFMIIPSSEIPETFRQICHSLRSVGPSLKFLIDSPSSVEGSEEDTCVPSVRKVAETILDIALVSFSKHHSKSCLPVLVLGNIENSLSAAHIAAILKRYGAYPTQISFLDLKKDLKLEHVALIHFRTVSEAKTLHSRLYKEEESSHLGALLHRIPGSTQNSNIRWLNYRALDPDYNWTALVLRNFPENYTQEFLRIKFGEISFTMVPARYINNHLCTILILNKIEDAYTLIRRYKRQGMQGNIDIHPYSSMFKKPRSFVSSLGLDINHKKSRIFIEPESPNKKFKPNESPVSSDFGELELKTTGGSMEDGEIIGEDEDVRDQDYQLFEYPGVYWMKDITELSHSGVMVKTSLARDGSL